MANLTNFQIQNLAALTAVATGTTVKSAVCTNSMGRGIVASLTVSSLGAGAPTATLQLACVDPAGNATLIGAASSAITLVVGNNPVVFYPGLGAASTTQVNMVLPLKYQIWIVTAGTGTTTGTLSAQVIV